MSPIPLLSIIDALAEKLIEDGVRKVGLLGTKFTLTKPFYVEGLRKYGVEAIIPGYQDIEEVNRIIYSELAKGIVKEDSRRKLVLVAKKIISKGLKQLL